MDDIASAAASKRAKVDRVGAFMAYLQVRLKELRGWKPLLLLQNTA
jgi:hypothetical protein